MAFDEGPEMDLIRLSGDRDGVANGLLAAAEAAAEAAVDEAEDPSAVDSLLFCCFFSPPPPGAIGAFRIADRFLPFCGSYLLRPRSILNNRFLMATTVVALVRDGRFVKGPVVLTTLVVVVVVVVVVVGVVGVVGGVGVGVERETGSETKVGLAAAGQTAQGHHARVSRGFRAEHHRQEAGHVRPLQSGSEGQNAAHRLPPPGRQGTSPCRTPFFFLFFFFSFSLFLSLSFRCRPPLNHSFVFFWFGYLSFG